MNDCQPYRDIDDGGLYCPKDYTKAPDCGESWDDFCDACQQGKDRYDELRGDMERDEE